ncbi:MAG: hypothetical protein RL108_77 [Bacteroidota bacterium]|jgi:hypothetical protein
MKNNIKTKTISKKIILTESQFERLSQNIISEIKTNTSNK